MSTRTINTRISHAVLRCTTAPAGAFAALALFCAPAQAAETVSPLPASAYTVRTACPAPAPGHAACMALQLVARTPAARAHMRPIGITRAASSAPSSAPSPAAGDFGLRPQDLHSAYTLPADASTSSAQTIALVDAYNDPNAETDLEAYDTEFGLPACTTANGCFKKVNQNGSSEASQLPFPQSQATLTSEEALCKGGTDEEACFLSAEARGWSVEISLDIETARAVCQNCHITLVEADEPSYEDLDAGEETAAQLGAQEISNSWGSPECDEGFCERESVAFEHPGVVITVAAGDDGYLSWLEEPRSAYAGYPASLPQVVAVGGTRLYLGSGSKWDDETVWNDGGKLGGVADGYGAGGGGCSTQFTAKPWQQHVSDWSSVGCGSHRAVADVAADADPYTGLAVYDTSPECEYTYKEGGTTHVLHWCPIGGTSLASPLIASVFALAGGAGGVQYPAQTLYQNAVRSPASLHDVTEGSSGECAKPFTEEEPFTTACTQEQEAKTSCEAALICQAGAGYDGPTGLGTPDGLVAFELPSGGLSEEGSEVTGGSGSGSGSTGAGGPPASGVAAPSPGVGAPTAAAQVQLSGLALTLRALVALNTSRPRIADLSFTFMANVTASVRVTLGKRVVRRGHRRWRTLTRPLTIAALSGRNNHRLSGGAVLSPGTYRLTLAPAGGAARSLVFKIG